MTIFRITTEAMVDDGSFVELTRQMVEIGAGYAFPTKTAPRLWNPQDGLRLQDLINGLIAELNTEATKERRLSIDEAFGMAKKVMGNEQA